MKVAVYLPTYNDKHADILKSLAAGIPGAIVKKALDFTPGEADIGVVFGWYKNAFKPTHSKRPIIEYYRKLGPRRLLMVESAFQNRARYFQVGWNGFAGYADFRNENMPGDRWEKVGIPVRPWRGRMPNHKCIVIGQLPRDTQVQDVNHVGWCQQAVIEAQRAFGAGNVVFRPHPRCDRPSIYGVDPAITDGTRNIAEVLRTAFCVVTWNSTTGVDALVNGVPVIAMDKGAIAWDMASHAINRPLVYPDRNQWFANLGYTQWTIDEMKAGLPWRHLTR